MTGPHIDRWSNDILTAGDAIRNSGIKAILIFKRYSVRFVGVPNDVMLTRADNDNDNDRFPVNQG